MHIHCLGINHQTAPVSLREQLAFNDYQVSTSLARLGRGGWTSAAEMVILSTCNRIEIYAVSSDPVFTSLEIFLSEARNLPVDEISPFLYRLSNEVAVRHLFNVAAGLDSLVLGEPQILGQVTRALELARGQCTAGPLLSRLFHRAIHAGKRARTETAISRNPASVSSLAASLCERSVADLTKALIVILGAGEMAELAVEALRKRGASRLLVINRTLENAHALANRWMAEASTFESLDTALLCADILVSSTGAPHTLVNAEMVSAAMQTRSDRPLVLIDIAVPRDIDPEVGDIPNVKLYDMDNLNVHLEYSMTERAQEVPMVEAILAEEEAKFLDFLNSLDMLPLIAGIRQQAESIRQAELAKTLRRLPDLTETERIHIEALTQALVKKLFDVPTNRLRAEATCPHAPEYATVAQTLFGLPGEYGLCHFSEDPCPISTAAG